MNLTKIEKLKPSFILWDSYGSCAVTSPLLLLPFLIKSLEPTNSSQSFSPQHREAWKGRTGVCLIFLLLPISFSPIQKARQSQLSRTGQQLSLMFALYTYMSESNLRWDDFSVNTNFELWHIGLIYSDPFVCLSIIRIPQPWQKHFHEIW